MHGTMVAKEEDRITVRGHKHYFECAGTSFCCSIPRYFRVAAVTSRVGHDSKVEPWRIDHPNIAHRPGPGVR